MGRTAGLPNCLTPRGSGSAYVDCTFAQTCLGEVTDSAILMDVKDGALRIREIARDLKTFSRTTTAVETVDFAESIRSALRIAGPMLRSAVTITTELDPSLRVAGSPGRLCQVFVNLFINAAQAASLSAAPVQLFVETRREDERVIAKVRDTGPGISPENLSRVFDAFFTTKPADSGTGAQ